MYAYFARHGESEANVLGIFSHDGDTYGLTEKGRSQALELARSLKSERIGKIFCSPLQRAEETAQVVAKELGLTVEVREALKEFSVGDLEGCTRQDAWRQFSQVESQWMVGGDPHAKVADGECLDDVRTRFLSVIHEIVQRFGSTEERVLVIGHGGTLSCSLPAILENVDNRFALDHPIKPAGLIVSEWIDPHFRCLRWTDTILSAEEELMVL